VSSVFLVQHLHEFADGSESVKIIGVYSSRDLAQAAIGRAARLDGFKDLLTGFSIDEYILDEDNWTSGFFTDA
jgi:hypothetical protein